ISVQYYTTSTKNNQQISIDHMYLTINYIKETTEPVVKLNDPGKTNIYTSNNTVTLNYTVQEDYPDYCNIWSNFNGNWEINHTEYTPQENNSHTVTLPHGTYKWTVECVDLSSNTGTTKNNTFQVTDVIGNAINSTPNIETNITIDNRPLNITEDYEGILNVTIHNATEPMVSFTHDFSEMLDLRSIDLAAGNGSIATSIPGKTVTLHVPVKDSQCNTIICEGVMDAEGCTSSDQEIIYKEPDSGYCNVIVDGTWAQDQPDETDAKATDLYPETYDIKEGDNITLFGEVSNEGNTIFPNLTIRFLDETVIASKTIYNLSPEETITLNTTWIAGLATNDIELQVDPPIGSGEFAEFNESNNNMSITLDTGTWQTYYGDISGNITLGDGASTAHVWIPENTGNVYIADSDQDIDWSSLQSLGRNNESGPASQDFLEADTALNLTGHPENITGLFSTDGSQPKETTTMTIKGQEIQEIPVINSTDSSDFRTGILWDASIGNEYDGSQHLIFVTKTNKDTPGRFGTYDYEIRVPAQLEDADTTTEELAVYVEII
ncbi:MAG: CARDB domain-containing protein, partial [Candidatus Woesearchaeota archaeon]